MPVEGADVGEGLRLELGALVGLGALLGDADGVLSPLPLTPIRPPRLAAALGDGGGEGEGSDEEPVRPPMSTVAAGQGKT